MRAVKVAWITLGAVAAVYVLFVVWFEAIYLGYHQPSFEDSGIPMLVLETTSESGETKERMLARLEIEDSIYVSAHHWPRGWYQEAVENPKVRVEIGGVIREYVAVPVQGAEFERVDNAVPLGFGVRFLMGFPPERDILRLDPAKTSEQPADD